MALDLQLTDCNVCNRKYFFTLKNHKNLMNPEAVKQSCFEEQIKDDQQYCTCEKNTLLNKDHIYHQNPNIYSNKKALIDYIDQDIYFYDLYITYNNFHQDIPTRQAI
jgi:hypothetical protein